MRAADILPYELVQVYNISNGERFETYAIQEPPGSGTIALKGAAARKGALGDLIIIACYTTIDDQDLANFEPVVILVDEANQVKEDT
jgi:aspartate 1-decarboxylase